MAATACLVGLVGLPRAGLAQKPRVAMLEVEGADSDDLMRQLAGVLRKRYRVVGPGAYDQAAFELDAGDRRARSVARVARKLALHAVILGTLEPGEFGYELKLQVRNGATGRSIGAATATIPSERITRPTLARVGKRLQSILRRAKPAGRGAARNPDLSGVNDEDDDDDDIDDDEELAEDNPELDDDEAAPRALRNRPQRQRGQRKQPARQRVASLDNRDLDDEEFDADADEFFSDGQDQGAGKSTDEFGFDDDEFADGGKAGGTLRGRGRASATSGRLFERLGQAKVTAAGGVAVIARTLRFNARVDERTTAPSQLSGVGGAGAYLHGAVYPLRAQSAATAEWLSNVSLGFEIERSVGMSAPLTADGLEGPVELALQRQRYGIRAQYERRFGSLVNAAAGLGYQVLAFTIDRANMPSTVELEIPNTKYRVIDPGVEVRMGRGRIALRVDARSLVVLDAGDIVSPEEYGQARISGGSADVGIEYLLADKWLVRAGGQATVTGYSFVSGAGERSSGRDGDPTTLDVGGARDRFLGGYATLGVIY
jgi:hypothetical protein